MGTGNKFTAAAAATATTKQAPIAGHLLIVGAAKLVVLVVVLVLVLVRAGHCLPREFSKKSKTFLIRADRPAKRQLRASDWLLSYCVCLPAPTISSRPVMDCCLQMAYRFVLWPSR